MILHEPFVNVKPLYTTMDIDSPRPLLLSSLQPSVLPEITQRKQGPLSQIPLSFQQTNITKCCKRYIILCIYDKKSIHNLNGEQVEFQTKHIIIILGLKSLTPIVISGKMEQSLQLKR